MLQITVALLSPDGEREVSIVVITLIKPDLIVQTLGCFKQYYTRFQLPSVARAGKYVGAGVFIRCRYRKAILGS